MKSSVGWRPRPISDLIEGVIDYRGKTPPKSPSGIPCISAANIKNGSVVLDGKFVSEETYIAWATRGFVKPGDVLITTEAPVGEVAQLPGDQTYLITRRVIALQVDSQEADAAFLKYALREPIHLRRFASMAHGATVPRLFKEDILEYQIEIPEPPVQHKIASILSAYDNLIENNLRRIQILEEMAEALYREWFVKFRFPLHGAVEAAELPNGIIPNGWRRTALGELVHQERRSVKPSQLDPETPYIGLEHLPRRSITLAEWGKVGEVGSTKLRFKRGDILFGKIRPYFHKVGVAPLDGVCSSDAIVVVVDKPEHFSIALCCMSSDAFVAHATQTSQGTKMPRANWDVLVKYPILLPPTHLLDQFNEFIEAVVARLQNFIWSNKALRESRDLLLPKLISGELDVSDLDIDVGEAA